MNTYTGPLADIVQDVAESLRHAPASKFCGNCLAPFHAMRAPEAVFGATRFFQDGSSHRVTRFICAECHSTIRSLGPFAALQQATELEIAGELLVSGPLK